MHECDTRIMVTLPPEAAQDADFAEAILRSLRRALHSWQELFSAAPDDDDGELK